MALPWLIALKVIPWSQVIEHAPTVLKSARRLLDRYHGTPAPGVPDVEIAPGEPTDLATLQRQLVQLQRKHSADMEQLSETVAELAEQNSRLVQTVDALRRRTLWLGGALLALAAAGLAIWFTP